MNKSITVSAPGKIHFLGEHSVVYGKKALLTATDKRCFVTIQPITDNNVEIEFKNRNKKKFGYAKIETIGKNAQKQWEIFAENNDSKILNEIINSEFDYPVIIIYETLKALIKTNQSGFRITIDSKVPIGVGMGSSAALSVSVAAAVLKFFGKPLDKEVIQQIAYSCEQKIHGFPSGADTTTCIFGGLVTFQRSGETKNILSLDFKLPENLAQKFCFINTGKPDETTGEMVSEVKQKVISNKQEVEKIFNEQGKLVEELIVVLKNNDENAIQNIIKQGEANLEKLGVVSKSTQALIRNLEKAGFAAKICGAGGVKRASGIVLVFGGIADIIQQITKQYGFKTENVKLGEEGIRAE